MITLATPLTIHNKEIKNRLVMPPMVCFNWSDTEGYVSNNHIEHYINRAKGGAGIIIVEAVCISPGGRLADSQLGIWHDDFIEGFKKIAEGCHQYGAKVLMQIHHAGYKAPETVAEVAVAPSEYEERGRRARALTLEEIEQIKKDFVLAARRASQAGLDGVEIHGAHGYLLSQFCSPMINKRTDQYGGELANRVRLSEEVVAMIKAEVPEDFIIAYRMGANEPSLDEGIEIAKCLEQAGVELLHVSSGVGGVEIPEVPEGFAYNWIVYMGIEVKKYVKIPVIVVNSIQKPEQASRLIEQGLADFVAVGRGFLVDDAWAEKQ